MVPAFPMDEDRVLRSIFTGKMSCAKATHSAASIGKFIAILMAIFGIYGGDIWLLLIALYIYGEASNEDRNIQIREL